MGSSRGHGAFVGLLLGSVGPECLTHASCPSSWCLLIIDKRLKWLTPAFGSKSRCGLLHCQRALVATHPS